MVICNGEIFKTISEAHKKYPGIMIWVVCEDVIKGIKIKE